MAKKKKAKKIHTVKKEKKETEMVVKSREFKCITNHHIEEVEKFATSIGKENLINISANPTSNGRLISVWYWKKKEG